MAITKNKPRKTCTTETPSPRQPDRDPAEQASKRARRAPEEIIDMEILQDSPGTTAIGDSPNLPMYTPPSSAEKGKPPSPPDREGEIEYLSESWWGDDRDLQRADSPAAEFCKLGVPERTKADEQGVRHQHFHHLPAVTNCSLHTTETNKYGFPVEGHPQIKITGLRETQGYALLYLRYLQDLIQQSALSNQERVFNYEDTNILTNEEGVVYQIDLAFKTRLLAPIFIFNTNFLVPMFVQPEMWADPGAERVLPNVYVWSPPIYTAGPMRLRTVQISSPHFAGLAAGDVAGVITQHSTHNWGGAEGITRIRKGDWGEPEEDAELREVVLLETVIPEHADKITHDKDLDFGFPTTRGLLPATELKREAGRREVAVIDYSERAWLEHRGALVRAITDKLSKLAVSAGLKSGYGRDSSLVFQKHLSTPKWAPSDSRQESLLQWKRNTNVTFNFYAVFTQEAYDILADAGTQTVKIVVGKDPQTEEDIITPVTVEVGQWSERGAKSQQRNPRQPRARDEATRAAEAAVELAQDKSTEQQAAAIQQALVNARPSASSTPETKSILKDVRTELELLNSKAVTAAARTETLEAAAEQRHTEVTAGINSFHTTYKSTGEAMVTTLTALTDRITGPMGTVPQAQAAEAGGQNHHQAQPASGGATGKPSPPDSPYRGIPYTGPKPRYTIPKRQKKAEGGPEKKKKKSATEEEFHSPQLTIVTRQACRTKRQHDLNLDLD
ncbi:hypothetical protein CYMTET_41610 [Cymbomonas tetramitiformis]|uniref:Uncharacterized protein n=1 Tax=Cymbomonas tetramitiformis TaxID=36881 RepID=A0AAE0C7G7_9CHLO|nr:hypothetical protein CYMTET_41610 [Cymbomonas tetramitiformis]